MSGWREDAARQVEVRRKQQALWAASYQRDLEWIRNNAERMLEILNSDDGVAEALAAARASGGRKGAAAKQAVIEQRVLARIEELGGDLPEPRKLMAALLAKPGLRRDSAREALRKLAAARQLPERYAAHFA